MARLWRISSVNTSVIDDEYRPSLGITMKIRGEQNHNEVPEVLYSSHKYQMEYFVKGKKICDEPLISVDLLLLDDDDEAVVHRNGEKCWQPYNSPPMPILIYEEKQGGYYGRHKIHFTTSSFKMKKKNFKFHLKFMCGQGLVFIAESPLFEIRSRKTPSRCAQPVQGKEKVKKKKRKRKPQSEVKSSEIEQKFESTLFEIIKLKQELSQSEWDSIKETIINTFQVVGENFESEQDLNLL